MAHWFWKDGKICHSSLQTIKKKRRLTKAYDAKYKEGKMQTIVGIFREKKQIEEWGILFYLK